MTGKELRHRTPRPHYAKGDLTAANARLADLTEREGRPPKPVGLVKTRRASLALTKSAYLALKDRADFEGIPVAWLVRNAIEEYLRIHRGHLG